MINRDCIQRFITSCILMLITSLLYSYINDVKDIDRGIVSTILLIFVLGLCLQALTNSIFTIISINDDGIDNASVFNIFSIIISGSVFLITLMHLISPIIEFIIHGYKI